MKDFWNYWHPRVLALLRMVMGFLIFWHGTQKLFGYPPSEGASGELSGLLLLAGILEFIGGILLFIGLFTNWAAFILSGTMAVAYFMVYGSISFLPIVNHGELSVIYCFVFFYLFFSGGGAWSIDNYLVDKRVNQEDDS
ncbi:MAG: DoxX family protein [Bacteroidota bacterium]